MHIYTHVCECLHVHVCACECVCARACVCLYVFVYALRMVSLDKILHGEIIITIALIHA